mgnify:CR=1 FL=1
MFIPSKTNGRTRKRYIKVFNIKINNIYDEYKEMAKHFHSLVQSYLDENDTR